MQRTAHGIQQQTAAAREKWGHNRYPTRLIDGQCVSLDRTLQIGGVSEMFSNIEAPIRAQAAFRLKVRCIPRPILSGEFRAHKNRRLILQIQVPLRAPQRIDNQSTEG